MAARSHQGLWLVGAEKGVEVLEARAHLVERHLPNNNQIIKPADRESTEHTRLTSLASPWLLCDKVVHVDRARCGPWTTAPPDPSSIKHMGEKASSRDFRGADTLDPAQLPSPRDSRWVMFYSGYLASRLEV